MSQIDNEREFVLNTDYREEILFGHSMAESVEVLTNANDRLDRFSLEDDTSEELMLLGLQVGLNPTYLAQLEFIKAQFENQVATLKAAYEDHLYTYKNRPVEAAVEAYIKTLNGNFSIEANQQIDKIRKGKGIPYDPSYNTSYQASLLLEDFFDSAVKIQVELTISGQEYGLTEIGDN